VNTSETNAGNCRPQITHNVFVTQKIILGVDELHEWWNFTHPRHDPKYERQNAAPSELESEWDART